MIGPRSDSIRPALGIAFLLVFLWATAGIGLAEEVPIAGEFPFTDSLEPDALEEDALEPNALDEDALGLESFDPELFRRLAQMRVDLPVAVVPPRPPQAIPMYFCWRCWAWRVGTSRIPLCPYHRWYADPDPPPAVVGKRVPVYAEIPLPDAKEGETE